MRQDVFRVAYDEAIAELIEIKSKIEQLILRRARLEGVVRVLGPLLETTAPAHAAGQVVTGAATGTHEQNSDPAAYSFNQVPVPLPDLDETAGDPFKRRVRNALKSKSEQQGLQTAV
jgi:hypothetical protein